MAEPLPWAFVRSRRPRDAEDPFFELGNAMRGLSWKRTSPAEVEATLRTGETPLFACGIAGCPAELPSAADFEAHYFSCHANECLECHGIFASKHLLELHLEECHDMFFALRSERGEAMYRCLVPACVHRALTRKARRQHLIEVHRFPSDFQFSLVVGKLRKEHARRGRTAPAAAAASPKAAQTEIESDEDARDKHDQRVEPLAAAADTQTTSQEPRAATRVPRQIAFGRGRGGRMFRPAEHAEYRSRAPPKQIVCFHHRRDCPQKQALKHDPPEPGDQEGSMQTD